MTTANDKANNSLVFQALLTKDEYKVVLGKAKTYGLSLSNYLRIVAIHCDPKIIILPDLGPREKLIQARGITQEQFEEVEKRAEALGIKLPEYLRLVAVHSQINITLNKNAKTAYKSNL